MYLDSLTDHDTRVSKMIFSTKHLLCLTGCLAALTAITSCTQVAGPNRRPVQGMGQNLEGPAKAPASPSAKGSYLAKSDAISFELSTVNPDAASAVIQAVEGQAFQQALQARYTNDDHGPWMAVLKTVDTLAMPREAAVIATFHARSAAPYNGARDAVIGFYVYREDPWHQLTANRIVVDDQWREYSVIFTPDQRYKAGELSVAFDIGQKKQTVEIGNIRLRDLAIEPDAEKAATSSTYAGRSIHAEWRKAAAQRIEQHRKGPMRIRVLDTSGKPAGNAQVSYALKQHAFSIGTAVNKRLVVHQDTPDYQRYAREVTGLFNKAVLENGMKWNQWDSSYAPFLKEDTLKAVAWLSENKLTIRGTALVWPGWDKQNPAGLKNLKPVELQQRVDDHIRDLVGIFKGRVSEWDVVNESRTNKDFTRVLGPNTIPRWFKLAGSIDPQARLYLNDFGILNGSDTAVIELENTVKAIQQAGAPIHGIGLQSHFDSYLPSPERMQEILDRLGKLGIDIQATEFDVNIADEATQADFTRDFVTVLFSHPQVTGITLWGFWEGQHWKQDCALFRQDWSIKPNGQVFLDLFNKEWTSKGKLAGGTASAFYGEYELRVSHGGKTSSHTISHKANVQEHIIDLAKPGKPRAIALQQPLPKPVIKPKQPKPVAPVIPPVFVPPVVVKPAVVTPGVVVPVVPAKPGVIPPKLTKPKPVTPPRITLPAVVKPAVPKPAIPRPNLPKARPPVVRQPVPSPRAPSLTLPVPGQQPRPPTIKPESLPVPTQNTPKPPQPVVPSVKPEGPQTSPPVVKKPSVTLPKASTSKLVPTPSTGAKLLTPDMIKPRLPKGPPKITPPQAPQPKPGATPAVAPKAAEPASTEPMVNSAQERMIDLKERLRKARERMQNKAAEPK